MASSIRASATTTIDRDVNDVFAYVADIETMDEWVTGVSGTTLVSGDGGTVGDVYEYEYTYGGGSEPMRVELTAVEEPRLLAMEALEGPFPFEGELTLASVDGSTRVTNTIEPGSDGRFTTVMFTVFAPVMRWLMRRRLRSELDELKANLESEDGDSGSDPTVDSGASTPV